MRIVPVARRLQRIEKRMSWAQDSRSDTQPGQSLYKSFSSQLTTQLQCTPMKEAYRTPSFSGK
ncbi:MAG: hypothetical protein AAFR93_14795, partial [Pseudomonadota bacterium]